MTRRVHGCLECGLAWLLGDRREFCSARCRTAWNNRRKQRGALLYDLYMAHRFDRSAAHELGVFPAINRLAATFREEDQARAGRRSWRPPAVVLEERPYLRAQRGPTIVV